MEYTSPFAYAFATVIISFGLFNLIMAIFVENTMQAAKYNDQKIAAARHKENLRLARKLRLLIREFHKWSSRKSLNKGRSKSAFFGEKSLLEARGLLALWAKFQKLWRGDKDEDQEDNDDMDQEFKVTKEQFDQVIATEVAQKVLDELEIDELDRRGLFDVLDADGSGTLTIEELISGMMAVRGVAKKSDSIATMLSVRCMQTNLRTTCATLLANQHTMQDRLHALESNMEVVLEAVQDIRASIKGTSCESI